MKTKLYFVIFLLLFIVSNIVSAQTDYLRRLPGYLLPEKALTESEISYIQNFAANSNRNLFISKPLPKEVWQRPPAPERILASDGLELINISKGSAAQSETWIAFNPTNPNNIIATSNDSRYMDPQNGYSMPAFYTTDKGQTWKQSNTPKMQNYKDVYIKLGTNPREATIFDPGVAFDSRGWAYYSYGFTLTSSTLTTDNNNGVFVCRSTNGGKSWDDPFPVAMETAGQNQPFNDRYSIVADQFSDSPYKNNVYVTWTIFPMGPAVMAFSRSEDDGQTWSNSTKLPGGSNGSNQSPIPAVGPNGVIYVVWRSQNEAGTVDAVFQKSTDAGKTWLNSPKIIQNVVEIGTKATVGNRRVLKDKQNMRISSYPILAVDNSQGSRRGWIYVVQTGKDDKGKISALYLTRSKDGGVNWESKIRIDNNDLNNDVFLPSIAVDPISGLVAVLYYSSQNDAANKGVDAYLALSFDGINFNNLRITPETWYLDRANDISPQPGEAGNNYWGDYTSIIAYNSKVYPCFWMPQPLTGDFNSLELFTANISTSPKPPENIGIDNTNHDVTSIKLKWTDPTQNVLGGPIGDYKIVIIRNGNQIAQVDKGLQTYLDNGLTSGQKYDYQIKTKTTDGLESQIRNFSAIAGGAAEPLPPSNVVARPSESGVNLYWDNPIAHIDSSYCSDLSAIEIYKNDTLFQTVTTNIQPGSKGLLKLQLPLKNFYKIKLKSVSNRNSVNTKSIFSPEVLAYSGAPLSTLNENWDDANTRIATYTDGKWAMTNKASKSSPNSITDSPTSKQAYGVSSIILAPVIINAPNTTLSFDNIACIKPDGDYAAISASNDFGNTWKELYRFDKLRSTKFNDSAQNSSWDDLHVTLLKFNGDTVYVKFTVSANVTSNLDGWYIDNIVLDDNPNEVKEGTPVIMYPKIFPNPSANLANLKFVLSVPSKLMIELYDAMGNSVYKIAETESYAGELDFPIDLTNVSSGIYYIRISDDSGTRTVPIVVEK
ncbi:MAG: hypothetical protein HW421_2391 [Ignavibacteria bacterium]|nr:hypothetical protein [Ignavibacteria bacterium]